MKTVVGLYSSVTEANKVKSALQSEGYETAHITVIDKSGHNSTDTGKTEVFAEKVREFFTGFGEHKEDHTHYANSIGNGDALLAVTVPDGEADETADMLLEHGATAIQGDYAKSTRADDVAALEGDKGNSGAFSGDTVIPVVREDLVVGKRQVDRGGVRIYSHTVEQPATADVTLRNERVVVDRHPVSREATEADFNTGTGVVELTARGEEAVVGKTSRVVEEVRIGKEATEHTEQINDTVRRTEVEVEQTPTTETANR